MVIVDGVKSDPLEIKAGVPQGSRLGPILFIIYMNDIIQDIESDILIFADDTSLFATGSDPAETVSQLNRDLNKISSWAKQWKVSFNAKKSKDIIFSKKYVNNSPPLCFDGLLIDRVNKHKHLGLLLTSTLDFSQHVNDVCLRANRKLSVLRSVNILNRQTLDLLYKLTVRSVIDYGLPVYYKSLTLSQIGRLESIQYKAGKIVTGALQFTSKDKLNLELGWESIVERGNILSLNIFHKIHRHETRPLIKSCMPKLDIEKNYTTRSKGGYIPFKYENKNFNTSFFPYTLKLWNNLPRELKVQDVECFKISIKSLLKPKRRRHFSCGSKLGNKFLTQIRLGRSDLQSHKFSMGFSESPECQCHCKYESTEHYFLHCFLYSPERRVLLSLFEHYIPTFKNLNNKQKLNIIISGIDTDDPVFFYLNKTLTIAVQNFILQTKRFNV